MSTSITHREMRAAQALRVLEAGHADTLHALYGVLAQVPRIQVFEAVHLLHRAGRVTLTPIDDADVRITLVDEEAGAA